MALISSAATYYFPDATSDVEVYTDTTGQIVASYPAPASPHYIRSGDDVSINFSCSWDDQRTGPPTPPDATFNFTLTAIYSSTTYYATYQTTTNGGSSGSTVLNVLVLNVITPATINITYNTTAWVTAVSGWNDKDDFSADYTFI